MSDEANRVEAFISYWQGREGGQERANYGLFLIGLCDALGLPRPEPASARTEDNDYVFERAVKDRLRDGTPSDKRIDLYRRGSFILEAKQSRWKGGSKEIFGQSSLFTPPPPSKRHAGRAWDVLMRNARQQAEDYVRLLPAGHEPPPFLIVCDVGHCFEIYANFRRDGKVYDQFPDRRSFRVFLEDLRDPKVRDMLRAIWTDPLSLDPARHAAQVTRAIARRLAAVSKALDKKHRPEEVAMFLMRCLFTMFAEDVELLPKDSFRKVLERCETDVGRFQPMVGQLWEAMDKGEFAYAIEQKVKRFNGAFFKERKVLPLGREEIGELRQAASHDWRAVDPSIFGTLLEQALDPDDRRRLGAHYTPRAYVERLVVATVIEPLRADWDQVASTVEKLKAENKSAEAIRRVQSFHDRLCATRILDPACGTGNFLYVSLELLKRLEGEVLEALVALGGQETLSGLEGHSVDPHQFLGLEINPRAAAIAELVLWIGHLQWQLRNTGLGTLGEGDRPILRAFKNIQVKDAVLEADISLARDASGRPITRPGPDGTAIETDRYVNPRRPDWPAAEFIVGNPPFIGKGEPMRSAFGQAYLAALWKANRDVSESSDFVMFWWSHAADILTSKKSILRRFGFVSTNSITQLFNRRTISRFQTGARSLSIVYAVADHPWTKAFPDAAAVRISMTVAQADSIQGRLDTVISELGLEGDTPMVELSSRVGLLNPDLTIGADTTSVDGLKQNSGLSSNGMLLAGRGFVLTASEKENLFQNEMGTLIRPYLNGRELYYGWSGRFLIDCNDVDVETLRLNHPRIYQHLASTVRVEREAVYQKTQTRDAQEYARNWWRFAKSRKAFRAASADLSRFIGTTETAKHRVFQFVTAEFLTDHMVVGIASDDAFVLGILSSRTHIVWTLASGGTLEDRPRYSKSRTFDPFPFPATDDLQKQRIRVIAEEIDAHRKRVLAEHPHLTLTGLYNVRERLRAGARPAPLLPLGEKVDRAAGARRMRGRDGAAGDPSSGAAHHGLPLGEKGKAPDLTPEEQRIYDDGLVLILAELHDKLDAAVAAAYGWPADLPDEEILARLVALNKERAAEEARGLVRWLRPDYQIPRFGSAVEKAAMEDQLDLLGAAPAEAAGPKPSYPADDLAQTVAVWTVLAEAKAPLDAGAVAMHFRQGRRVLGKIAAVLAAEARIGRVATADGRSFALKQAA